MLAVMDILFSKEFQAQCTWTGASRKGPKTAIMSHPRIVDLFIEIGTSVTELMTQEKVCQFFMKKLKNATKRMSTTGQRMSSRHNVQKRARSVVNQLECVEQNLDTDKSNRSNNASPSDED